MTQHRRHYHYKYELTCEQYDDLLLRAEGRCDRCAEVRPRGLDIDHDHALGWGAVRGLVCFRCNAQLGHQERGTTPMDDATRDYLRRAWHLTNEPGRPRKAA